MTAPAPAQVRAAREAAGLTQTAAAALVHSSLRAWQQWEAGDRRMHPAFWELLKIKIALKGDDRRATIGDYIDDAPIQV